MPNQVLASYWSSASSQSRPFWSIITQTLILIIIGLVVSYLLSEKINIQNIFILYGTAQQMTCSLQFRISSSKSRNGNCYFLFITCNQFAWLPTYHIWLWNIWITFDNTIYTLAVNPVGLTPSDPRTLVWAKSPNIGFF